ncbi:MAG TPA: sulfate ABC transporter substrate-binding protein [Actinomycetota bacterium]
MRRVTFGVATMVAVVLVAAGCGATGGGGGGNRLSLVAYSTPREAYASLIPAFQKTAAGKGVSFSQSFGASGDQSRAVAAGLPADVVTLSLAPDMDKLADAGLVAKDWSSGPDKGMVTDSVVALVVRKGNPKGIRTWDDLVKPGVQVITPNPFSSGGARWNVMGAYGAQIEQGKSPAEATAYLERLFKNVPVQDKSAREALQTFVGGKGDAMIAYENEAIAAQQAGQPVDYVVPDQTILIENPIAVVTRSRHQTQAKAFVDFLRSPEGQGIFAQKGYRPVNPRAAGADRFPRPKGLFTIDDLGGWDQVTKTFFDKRDGVMAQIEKQVGVSVGS